MVNDYTSSALLHQKVADLVSHYLMNRINLTVWKREGRNESLDMDTPTANLTWQKISSIMSTTTNYNMAAMPEIKSAKEAKNTY